MCRASAEEMRNNAAASENRGNIIPPLSSGGRANLVNNEQPTSFTGPPFDSHVWFCDIFINHHNHLANTTTTTKTTKVHQIYLLLIRTRQIFLK